jgi:hypothetical protein
MNKSIDMLRAILRATRDGRLRWTKPFPQQYLAKGPVEVTIREIAPLIAGESETAGTQAFEVNVNGLIETFWTGTPGCDLVGDILAAGLPEWADHREGISNQVGEIIKRLGS